MTLRHVEIFTIVCQEGSVTKAAERLHISQPTVSVAIREFEEHYENALFERISHRLYLTPFGKKIYDYSLSILSLYSNLAEARPEYDVVRVGTGTAIGKLVMPKVVKEFSSTHSDVHVHVNVGDASRMYKLIMQNDTDFVIAETIDDLIGLEHKCIQQYPIVALCHRDNPLAKKHVITASDLADQDLLLREPSSLTRQLVNLYFENSNIDAAPSWESYSVQTLLNATMENLGISFHSLDHAVAFTSPDIVILKLSGFTGVRHVNLAYSKNKIFSSNIHDFIKCFMDTSRSLLFDGISTYNALHPERALNYNDELCSLDII